jgi:hypothetical protein
LGRLMLMLVVQTPQIKKFWKKLNGNLEEKYKDWTQLMYYMLLAANIPPKPKISPSSSSSIRYGSEYEMDEVGSGSGSDVENEKNLKILYEELKRNFGHLMEIIEVKIFFNKSKRFLIKLNLYKLISAQFHLN